MSNVECRMNGPQARQVKPWSWGGVRIVGSVWATLLLVICVRGALQAKANSVYPIFASAARNLLAGTDLYGGNGDPYRYSPLVAAVFVPFSCCPDWLGGVLWRLLNAAVYLLAFAWWCRVVLPRSLTVGQQAILYLLIVPLSVGSLNNAQSNPLILGLLLAGVAGVACRHWNWASGCLAAACLFKVYPVAIALLLTALYPRRLGGRFLGALMIGLALPFLMKPAGYVWDQYAGWLHHLQTDDRQQLPLELWYRDLRLLCRHANVFLSPTRYLLVQLFAAVGIAGFCLAGRWLGWEQRRLLTTLFTLGCCWMTVFGSATESSTYILLAPSLAWTLLDSMLRPAAWWLRSGLIATFGLFTVTRAAVWFPGGAQKVHPLGLEPLAGLFLILAVVYLEFHRGVPREEAGTSVGRPLTRAA
jgi:hypothetical protein